MGWTKWRRREPGGTADLGSESLGVQSPNGSLETLLTSPRPWRLAVDSDCDNEVDDPFAIAHALLSPDRVRVEALTSAHYCNERAATSELGLRKSHEAIDVLLDAMELTGKVPVAMGAPGPMAASQRPRESDASRLITDLALNGEGPLIVASIGAATNVASAIAARPEIAERLVVVWLGGHALDWPDAQEFNLMGDPVAAQCLLDGPAPLVLVPALGVSSHMLVSLAQLRQDMPATALGRHLAALVADQYGDRGRGYAKEIWDMAATGWAIQPDWVPTKAIPSPILRNGVFLHDADRHTVWMARWCSRNAIFGDFFSKMA